MAHALGSGHCCNAVWQLLLFYGWTEQRRPVNPKAEECASWLTRNGVTPGISPLCRDPARLIWNIYPLSAAHSIYTPRVLAVIATAVYIPPQADTSLALSKLHDVLSGFINKHPDAAFIIAGDFNKPTSGRSCRTFTSMYPVQLEDRIHWITATHS